MRSPPAAQSPPHSAPDRSPEPAKSASDRWAEMSIASEAVLSNLPLLEMPPDHTLQIRFEYCTAPRPGRNGSLPGSSKTYMLHYEQLRRYALQMIPTAQLVVNRSSTEERSAPRMAPAAPARSASASSLAHPRSFGSSLASGLSALGGADDASLRLAQAYSDANDARVRLLGLSTNPGPQTVELPRKRPVKRKGWEFILPPSEQAEWAPGRSAPVLHRPFTPRIGAFEMTITLRGPTAHARYGPVSIHSKLASGGFPVHEKVLVSLYRHTNELIREAEKPGGSAFNSGSLRRCTSVPPTVGAPLRVPSGGPLMPRAASVSVLPRITVEDTLVPNRRVPATPVVYYK